MGLDIGPKSIAANAALIATAKTIVWNGPQGVFEFPNFAKVTKLHSKRVKLDTTLETSEDRNYTRNE